MFDLNNKTALITGSSRGLGLAMARALGRAGATVILNGRQPARLREAAAGLKAEGIRACGYAFDITSPRAVAKALARAEKEIAPVDILVNNAGINLRGKLEEISLDHWRRVMDLNLTAALIVSQRVVKGMLRRRRGKIINIASLMSRITRPTTGPYSASKGGLVMLTRSMAVEWAAFNIQANAIAPGYFLTEMTQHLAADRKFNRWILGRTPARRWGRPEDLAGAVVFLAGAASDYVNGQVIYVDGGLSAAI